MATISFLVGGSATASKNVWKMQDDGSVITVTASYAVGSAAYNVTAIIQDLDGNYYIAAGSSVYKYNSSMTLQTTWATNGAYSVGGVYVIYGLAVDTTGYLAIAHTEFGTPDESVTLLDEDGAEVWQKDYQTGTTEYSGDVKFDSSGNPIGFGSAASGQALGSRYLRSDGSQDDTYWSASGAWSSFAVHVLSNNDIVAAAAPVSAPFAADIRRCTSADVEVWKTDISVVTIPYGIAVDDDDNVYVGGTRSDTKSIFKFQGVTVVGGDAAGDEVATYDTGGTVWEVDFDANKNLIAVGASGTDADANVGTIRILDTDLTLLRVYNDVTVIGLPKAIVAAPSVEIVPQAPVGSYKTYSRKLVAFANNEVWYESAAGTMTELTAANGDIDVTKPLDAFELDEKVFIANKTNLKVADFGNVKIQTDDIVNAGGHAYPLRKTTITGAGGAKMVIDYITAIDGAAYIYGTKLNATAFVAAELVTGTNSDATTVNFNIKAGTTEVDPPHWYDWAVYGGSAVYGTMPAEATIGCNWNGRACLSGNAYYPHQWWMLEQGNPWNVNWVALDAQAPVIGNDANAGETGDILAALIPYKDDFLIHGCAGSLWYNVGDPASGGSLLELSLTAGILGRDAFCWDKNDNLYILGTTGILRIPKGFGPPENITEEMYPDFIKDLAFNSSLHKISMGYDPQRHGIKIYRTTLASGGNTGWWFDLRKQGLFPESVPTVAAPYCMFYYNSVDPAYTGLLSGCTDGFIRAEDDDAEDDDAGASDSAINSYVTFGPLKLGDEEQEGILDSITGITTGGSTGSGLTNSNDLTFRVWTELSSDAIVEKFISNTSPKLAGTFAAPGRERGARRRQPVRGMYAGVRVGNSTAGQTWGLEHLIINGSKTGKVS